MKRITNYRSTAAVWLPITSIVLSSCFGGDSGSDSSDQSSSEELGVAVSSRTFENGEIETTDRWTVIDNIPSGASVSLVFDQNLDSSVIELSGSGFFNAYKLGGSSATNGGWDDTERHNLSFDINVVGNFNVYVATETTNGFRFVVYEPSNFSRGLLSDNFIYNGIGEASASGDWVNIQRDVAADISEQEAGNNLIAVHGVVARGNMRLDNIALSDGSGQNSLPVADAGLDRTIVLGESTRLQASTSFDTDGNISEWQWVDQDNNLIDSGETVVWTPAVAGDLFATLTVTDDDGDTNTDTVNVSVENLVSACAGAISCFDEANRLNAIDAETGDEFGTSIALSGSRMIVGALSEDSAGNDAGAAYIFDKSAEGIWSSSSKLVADDAFTDDGFGFSVDVDGDTAIVGAFKHELDSNTLDTGIAYLFERQTTGQWQQTQSLRPNDLMATDSFGISVSIDGERAIVGASSPGSASTSPGAAYVFVRQGETWVQTDKLVPADGSDNDQFGTLVDLQGSRVVIGARAATGIDGTQNAGAAYIYELDIDGTELSSVKIGASDSASAEHFGRSLSMDGDRILVGAYGDSRNGTAVDGGAAYIFELQAGGWTQTQKIAPTNINSGDLFGRRVSLNGDRALISAYQQDNGAGTDAGSAYLFQADVNGNWVEEQILTASNAGAGDLFGISVAIDDTQLAVGATQEAGLDNTQLASGAIYLFADADSREYDNTAGQASSIAVGETQTRSLHIPSDTDWLIFNLNSASTVTITSNGEASNQTLITLYDSAENLLLNGDTSELGNHSTLEASLPAGNYLIRVLEQNPEATVSEYTVSLISQ